MFLSLLFILILINVQIEAKNSCNDNCLTKTFCISSDGSGVCTRYKNNLVTAQFKVIPVFGKYDYLQLVLKGYNINPDDEKTIGLSFDRPKYSSNEYTCYKSSLGATNATFTRKPTNFKTGSSNYMNGVLNCSWTFNITSDIWPLFNKQTVDMIKDKSQSIALYHDSKKIQVASDTSQLPIYHAQYLKCCNKVHSNDMFALTFDQTDKKIRYKFYYFDDYDHHVTVVLTSKDAIKLRFDFDLFSPVIGFVHNDTDKYNITSQIENHINYKTIFREMRSWSTPFVLIDSPLNFTCNASSCVFDLEVQFDFIPIYAEEGVSLKNSSYLFESSLILITFSVLFQILIN